MEITDVKIFKARQKGPVLAYANVILNNQFTIRGITLLETEKHGQFISMPSRRLRNGEKHFRDVCHPLNSDTRMQLTEAVFYAYNQFLTKEE